MIADIIGVNYRSKIMYVFKPCTNWDAFSIGISTGTL